MIRRHLSREQKRELIAESLRSDPILRDRDHARRCGASPTTVGRVRAEEGIPTPDEVILSEVERSGDNDYQVGQRLGVSEHTVKRVREDSQNVQSGQNANAPSAPEPEPPAPSWEPAGHLHPAASPVETTKRPNLDPTTRTSRKALDGDSTH